MHQNDVDIRLGGGGRFEELGGYSRVRRVGNLVYVAGTIATEPSGRLHRPGDTYHQTKYAFERVAALLEDVGASLEDVVRTRAFLNEGADVTGYATAHGQLFGTIRPVTTAVWAGLTQPAVMVEVEVEAVVRDLGEHGETNRSLQRAMRVVIAGGHGQVALLLERSLVRRGDKVAGLIRNAAHADDLEKLGVEAVVLDLERATLDEVTAVLRDADAVVFAAGAGPGSGADRKESVDRNAAVLLADAAERTGVRRFVMLSAVGTESADPHSDDVYQIYLAAKKAADDNLRTRQLDWTIIQSAVLTSENGTGRVGVSPHDGQNEISRADVADVLAATLREPSTTRKQFVLGGGQIPISQALRSL